MADLQGRHKKPKFDARNPSTLAAEEDEEDAILELDEIGKKSNQAKRNAVRLEGYESDSSQENFKTRANEKAKAAKREKEDEDMFGEEEEEEVNEELADKKKEVKFMDEDEIEGQVANSKSGGHVSANFSIKSKGREQESSSESGDDEDRDRVEGIDEELGAGSKKKHAPKLDAFHMKNEAEEGRFDQSGNFVRNAADPYAVHDAWLQGSSKAEMKKARDAHAKREENRRQRELEDDAVPTSDLLARLMIHMNDDETVLECLARLGSKPQKKKQRKGENMEIDEATDPEARRRETVEDITGAADQLLARGEAEVYDHEKALLMRQYRRETGEDWQGPVVEKHFEFRWEPDGEAHGPYDRQAMMAWTDAGYFNEAVEFRIVGTHDWQPEVSFE